MEVLVQVGDLVRMAGERALAEGVLGSEEAEVAKTERMPTACCARPVSSDARVGEQSGVTWKLVNCSPSAASRSTFGVSMSEP